ncbi:putative transmembrane protein, partial [Toxoplasma gondii RUB]
FCVWCFLQDSPVFPIQMFSLKAVAEHPWPWSEIPVELQVCFIIICGHFLMLLFCWFLSAPLLDVLFVSFFGSLKLLSFFLMVLTFRDFGVFNSIFNLHLYVMDFGRYAIFIFTLVPMIGVLYTLYPVLCVMLGRQYITYIIPPPRIGKYRRGQTVLDAGRPGGEADFAQLETHPRGDEAGVVATVCLMVFLNCSHMLAPISMNQLLVGPNMIKAVRLNDGLLRVHWRQLLLTLLLRLWCFILYLTFPNSITYSKDPGAIERVLEEAREEKLNELALVAATGRSSISSTSPSTRHAGTREVRMIAEKYFAHCFHTCPGDFLPGFF